MTRFTNKYPYTDFHELNADWLLETVKDAEAEAKEAAETVETYNGRLTTVEGDLAPIKSAMPGIASSISDLTSGLGRVSSQVTTNTQDIADNSANIDNIEDRLTTYDQNFVNINNTFISDERRIGELEEYRTEAQVKIGNLGYSVAPLFDENAAYSTGDYVMSPTLKLHHAIVDIPAGTADIHDLTQFHPTDINNALHEGTLPSVTSADAGKVLTVGSTGEWAARTPSLTNEVPFEPSFTNANFRYVKNGNMVNLYAVFPVDTSISSGALMGHIPTEVQPPSYATGSLININGNYVPFYIDGATFDMHNLNSLSSGAWILTATYYTAN